MRTGPPPPREARAARRRLPGRAESGRAPATSRWRRILPARVALICAATLIGHSVVLGLLVLPTEPRLRHAALTVVAPAFVSVAVTDEINALRGRPLAARPATDPAGAVEDVVHGVVTGAVVVDLATTTDRLILNDRRDTDLNQAVADQVRTVASARGRTIAVEWVSSESATGSRDLGMAAVAASIAGFLLALAMSLARGPVPATFRLGLGRLLLAIAGSVALGGAAAPWITASGSASHAQVAAILGLAILLPATLTLALESLAGLGGLALGVTLFLVSATPLLLRTDPHLLPEPWPWLSSWTPSGATNNALEAALLFEGTGGHAALLVLAAWVALAILVLGVAGRERRRAHVNPDEGLDELPRVAAPRRRGSGLWRLRVAAVVLPSALVLFAAVSLLPPDQAVRARAAAEVATQTRCVATGQVQSVRDLNRIATEVRGGGEFQGGDVGAGAALQDGRRLLMFGDTLRESDAGTMSFVRNSMLLFGPGCIKAVLPPGGGAVIPDRSGSGEPVGYWPMSVSVSGRPGYDLVTVAAQRVRSTGSGAFDFENLGSALAVFVVPVGEVPQLIAVRDVGSDSADPTRPTWGAASVVHNGWTYLYGTAENTGEMTFGFALHLARARPERIQDPATWRYWDGRGWSANPSRAVELVPAEGGTSQTLSVFPRAGVWYALSKRDEFLGSDVVVWSAPHPWGPFDDGRSVARLPSNAATGQLRYMPLAHPDLLRRPGTVVISYSRNRTDLGEVLADPMRYRPRFMRVRLPDPASAP